MKSKNRLFVLIAAIGIFCCGCASVIPEESPISEANEASVCAKYNTADCRD